MVCLKIDLINTIGQYLGEPHGKSVVNEQRKAKASEVEAVGDKPAKVGTYI